MYTNVINDKQRDNTQTKNWIDKLEQLPNWKLCLCALRWKLREPNKITKKKRTDIFHFIKCKMWHRTEKRRWERVRLNGRQSQCESVVAFNMYDWSGRVLSPVRFVYIIIYHVILHVFLSFARSLLSDKVCKIIIDFILPLTRPIEFSFIVCNLCFVYCGCHTFIFASDG